MPVGVDFTVCVDEGVDGTCEEVSCVTTAWKMIGANHRVCIYAYDDPKIPGVTCHVSQAKTGYMKMRRRQRYDDQIEIQRPETRQETQCPCRSRRPVCNRRNPNNIR